MDYKLHCATVQKLGTALQQKSHHSTTVTAVQAQRVMDLQVTSVLYNWP